MTAPNHIVGGIVVTGLFGSFMGVNILASPYYIGTVVLAAQLPDIDHTKSPIGKICYPLARLLNRRYGHRTITHSFAALFLLTAIVSAVTKENYGTIFFLAYASHLVLDMLTIQGIPLFYPFARNPCVIPGDPKLRMKSGDLRSETIAFFFFIAMGIFLQPLMKTGFWTQYNRLFGTLKHVHSEFRKSEDLLKVTYTGHRGSERIEGEGYVVESTPTKAMLIQDLAFYELSEEKLVIEKVLPAHTGKQFFMEQQQFINIDLDSLNQLCIDKLIKKIEVHSNNEFIAWTNELTNNPSIQFKGEWYSNLFFEEAPEEKKNSTVVAYELQRNPKIQFLKDKIDRLQQQGAMAQQQWQEHQAKLDQLEATAKQERDYLKRELLIKEIKLLEKEKAPTAVAATIQDLQIQIKELIQLDQVKNEQGRRAVALKNQQEVVVIESTRFTGYLMIVKLE